MARQSSPDSNTASPDRPVITMGSWLSFTSWMSRQNKAEATVHAYYTALRLFLHKLNPECFQDRRFRVQSSCSSLRTAKNVITRHRNKKTHILDIVVAQSSQHLPLYRQIFDTLSEQIRAGQLPPGERVPSEKEIARQFGVSRITSKRALEMLAAEGRITRVPGKGSFVAEPIAASSDPTGAAGSLIALIVEDFADSFGTTLIHGVEEYCRQHGFRLVLYRSRWDAGREEEAIRDALALGVAGLLIMPVHGEYYSSVYLRLVLDRFPIVFVDRHLKGLEASFVGTDNVDAARRATDHLFDLGHRTVAWISPTEESASTIRDRELGVVQAHADRGIPVDRTAWITDLESTYAMSADRDVFAAEKERIRRHLVDRPEITAVFAEECTLAAIVNDAAIAAGRRIPQDLSIVTIDACCEYSGHSPFTYVRQKEFEMGTKAASILHRLIQHRSDPEHVLLVAELIEGPSTAPLQSI